MKYLYTAIVGLMIAGCTKPHHIEFVGNAPGIKSGVFMVKNLRDSTLFGVNIKNGKYRVGGFFNKPGYYTLNVTDDENKEPKLTAHEVYLDTGKYIIESEKGKLTDYPKITSSSAIQNEISAYNSMPGILAKAAKDPEVAMAGYVKTKRATMSIQQLKYILSNVANTTDREQKASADAIVLDYFCYKYSNNHIAAHEMVKLDYELNPVLYYEVYKKFTSEVKNSDDGKEAGQKLHHLLKLVPGVKAPALTGKTLDGKPFNIADLNKKVILIDFWRSGSEFARTNHQKIMDDVLPKILDQQNFGIVSVSLDTKPDWWRDAVNQHHMSWTQVCDFKGDDSPNAVNWSISTIPTYCLIDGQGRMIEYNIPLISVSATANKFMNRH